MDNCLQSVNISKDSGQDLPRFGLGGLETGSATDEVDSQQSISTFKLY